MCTAGPMVLAVFARERLERVELRHWAGRDGCRLAIEIMSPAAYLSRRAA